jgi:hypothetical protein
MTRNAIAGFGWQLFMVVCFTATPFCKRIRLLYQAVCALSNALRNTL